MDVLAEATRVASGHVAEHVEVTAIAAGVVGARALATYNLG